MSSALIDVPVETSLDAFLDGRIALLQPVDGPRAAIDALLLSASIPAIQGDTQSVLEAGTGTAIVSLALCNRVDDCQITAVDIQKDLLTLAQENISRNKCKERINLVEADITGSGEAIEAAGLVRESFDHVAANPPYFTSGEVRGQEDPSTALAYTAEPGTLDKWIRFLTSMVVPKGTLTLIHRAEALDELLALLKGRFGALVVYPLFPGHNLPAKRVLVQGIKGSRAPLEMMPGMVLHKPDGSYTDEANLILRDGKELQLRRQT